MTEAPGRDRSGEHLRRRAFDRGFYATGIMSLHATAAVITDSAFAAQMTKVFALAATIFWVHWTFELFFDTEYAKELVERWSA